MRYYGVGGNARALDHYWARRGWFDIAIKASGSVAGLQTCLDCVRAGSGVVQLGNIPGPHDQGSRPQRIVPRQPVIGQALAALADRRIVVESRLTARFPLAQAREAVEPALGRKPGNEGADLAEAWPAVTALVQAACSANSGN